MASTTCAGNLTVRALSATARVTACLIHHVAYVEKRLPISGSNFSTARIRPAFPSWIRSSKATPRPLYFLAMEMTSLRFDSISFLRAVMSPPRARRERTFSSSASSSLPPRTLPKYCVRTSCASIITSPLFISWSACQHACFAGLSAFQLLDSQALAEVLTSEARRAERADLLKCYSSCRRVRSPDPWASVGYEPFQDAIVQAGCDAPGPSARAVDLEAPPLAHFGHGRLFEGAQAACRQRPHVDLVLWLACGDERGIGP